MIRYGRKVIWWKWYWVVFKTSKFKAYLTAFLALTWIWISSRAKVLLAQIVVSPGWLLCKVAEGIMWCGMRFYRLGNLILGEVPDEEISESPERDGTAP